MKRVATTIAFISLITSCIQAQSHFKLFVENDLFGREKSDQYYTNGIKAQFINPKLQAAWTRAFMPTVDSTTNTVNTYGLSIGQNMYTARDIEVAEVIPGDRPYAGWLYLTYSKYSNNDQDKVRITSELSLGVLGPAAFGKEVQTAVHRVVNSAKPLGWGNQIKNDVGINYFLELEKQFYASSSHKLDVIWAVNTEVGTVHDNFGLSSLVRFSPFRNLSSYFASAYSRHTTIRKVREGIVAKEKYQQGDSTYSVPISQRKKLAAYLFVKSSVRFVAYNAFLQGGLVQGAESVYTISPNQVERTVLNFDVGIVFPIGYRFDVTAGQSFRTSEFQGAPVHYWGFIYLVYNFKN